MSLRRVVLALAVLCLMAGVASAQFSLAQQVTCTVSSSSQPSLRAESTHELVGDVILQCVSSITNPTISQVNQVPAVDITVNYGTAITSRQNAIGSPAVTYSDVALVLDDPNSNTVNPLVAGFGPGAPLASCGVVPITPAGATSEAPACNTYDVLSGGYYVISSGPSTGVVAPAANVYQGVISGQSVTFYGVPVVNPVQSGIYRKFRVVNVRVAPGSSTITANVSTGGPNGGANGVMLLSNASATVGAGKIGFTYTTSNVSGAASVATIVSQCLQPNSVLAALPPGGYTPSVALLNFAQNFANAAKPQGPYDSTPAPTGNVVAGSGKTAYGVYNAEAGVILPTLAQATNNASNGVNAAIPGAADSGTRFKAVFANLPYTKAVASTTIYVSLWNVNGFGAAADASGAGAGTTLATLSTGTGADVPGSTGTEFDTLTAAAGTALYTTGPVKIVPLTIKSDGTATAVWEVGALPAGKSTTFTFAVYVAFSSTSNTPALGNATVTLSAAPVQPASQPTPANAVQIPSFTTTPLGPVGVLSVVPCQTALLFPFVTTAKVTTTQHWETGIAISNTGSDPWATVGTPTATQLANETCTITFYGTGVASGSSTFTPPAVTSQPIGPGSNWAFVASDPLATGTSPNVGFSGYAFAVCNFNLAHGFAFVEDNSTAGNAMGYLALIVNNQTFRPSAPGGEGLLN